MKQSVFYKVEGYFSLKNNLIMATLVYILVMKILSGNAPLKHAIKR